MHAAWAAAPEEAKEMLDSIEEAVKMKEPASLTKLVTRGSAVNQTHAFCGVCAAHHKDLERGWFVARSKKFGTDMDAHIASEEHLRARDTVQARRQVGRFLKTDELAALGVPDEKGRTAQQRRDNLHGEAMSETTASYAPVPVSEGDVQDLPPPPSVSDSANTAEQQFADHLAQPRPRTRMAAKRGFEDVDDTAFEIPSVKQVRIQEDADRLEAEIKREIPALLNELVDLVVDAVPDTDHYNAGVLEYASDRLRDDERFVLAAVEIDAGVLEYASATFIIIFH